MTGRAVMKARVAYLACCCSTRCDSRVAPPAHIGGNYIVVDNFLLLAGATRNRTAPARSITGIVDLQRGFARSTRPGPGPMAAGSALQSDAYRYRCS